MDYKVFKDSINEPRPSNELSKVLEALWYDGKGKWEKAHDIAQDIAGADGALIHAYLHRKEGDNGNARYWYRTAGATFPDLSLDDEWRELVDRFLH